jgi:cyclomaltodextrinase
LGCIFANFGQRSIDNFMTVPTWVQDAVFYQIFPDRFFNGDPLNDPPNVQPWGADPTNKGFQGGDLVGIKEKLEYIAELGANAIYLNPIFASTANHRYHTSDYFRIDPTLGTMEDFHSLIEAAHRMGIKVILDGVFNHSGRGFFAFSDILDNGAESRYKDWYHIHHFPVDAFSQGPSMTYEAWWGIKDLPKLNTDNLQVRSYIMDVARYWIEQGADGWRLDVPGEIQDDVFWAEFRQTVKNANPDAYLVGEIWDADAHWVGEGHFDGLMHYPLRNAILDWIRGEITVGEFGEQIESFTEIYEKENFLAMFLSLGSHDTRRLWTAMGGDPHKVKLAVLLQFANPGAPSIYYGDEIGMQGEKDPFNRGAFPWENSQWNHELREYIHSLIQVRHQSPALRRGSFISLASNDSENWYVFAREAEGKHVLAAANASAELRRLVIPAVQLGWQDGQTVESMLSHDQYQVKDGTLVLPLAPCEGMLIKDS